MKALRLLLAIAGYTIAGVALAQGVLVPQAPSASAQDTLTRAAASVGIKRCLPAITRLAALSVQGSRSHDVLLVAPSATFLATLPNGKLPDRQDFYHYGLDHGTRIRAWETAIAECRRFAEAVMRWLERPDPTLIKPI